MNGDLRTNDHAAMRFVVPLCHIGMKLPSTLAMVTLAADDRGCNHSHSHRNNKPVLLMTGTYDGDVIQGRGR